MTLTASPAQVALEDPTSIPAVAPTFERVVSVDALRGFDMFWILGGEEIVKGLAKAFPNRVTAFLANQFEHVQWAGFRFYDLIFPTFVFVVGVSLVFSLGKLIRTKGRSAAVRRVIIRAAVIYLFGIIYYGGLSRHFWDIRLMGVLQRIALAYLFAGLLFCYLSPRALVIVTAGLLVGYWALLSFVPVPGVGHASFVEGKNWPNWFDAHYLPGFKWDVDHDPEGVLSTFPAIATCLLGVFAGLLLKDRENEPMRKVTILAVAGVAGVVAGYLWGLQFPVIKKLWTSSFVLVAGGYSALLLALFYYVVDVRRRREWCRPFVWIGMNAITLYMIEKLVDLPGLAARFVGGPKSAVQNSLGSFGPLVSAIVVVGIMLLIARFLYKRQIFLRV